MSSSTLVVNASPENLLKSKFQEPKSPSVLICTLWLFSSIFSASKIDFSSNLTGVAITFNMQDVVLVAFSAWMLHRGLTKRNVALVFPWVIVTLYGLYYNHYKSLIRMMSLLKHVRHATALPWLALLITSVGLVLRVTLTLRILQLSANLWYRKKLEKELYETLT